MIDFEEHKHLSLTFPLLRYPKLKIEVFKTGKINIFTFVRSKDKKRLALVRKSYQCPEEQDIFDFFKHVREDFNKACEEVKSQFIFNEHSSIKEVYNFYQS